MPEPFRRSGRESARATVTETLSARDARPADVGRLDRREEDPKTAVTQNRGRCSQIAPAGMTGRLRLARGVEVDAIRSSLETAVARRCCPIARKKLESSRLDADERRGGHARHRPKRLRVALHQAGRRMRCRSGRAGTTRRSARSATATCGGIRRPPAHPRRGHADTASARTAPLDDSPPLPRLANVKTTSRSEAPSARWSLRFRSRPRTILRSR